MKVTFQNKGKCSFVNLPIGAVFTDSKGAYYMKTSSKAAILNGPLPGNSIRIRPDGEIVPDCVSHLEEMCTLLETELIIKT